MTSASFSTLVAIFKRYSTKSATKMETLTISQYELERGKPVPRLRHSILQHRLDVAFARYDAQFSILPEIDLELGGKLFVPDVCVYPKQQVSWVGEEGPMREPPLLAVEILSQSQTMEQLFSRAQAYLDAGTSSVWLVVPPAQTVFVLKPNAKPQPFTTGIIKDERTGIELNVEELFK
ncbi:MAG: Uma2 family endonuclease [Chloroherpetonaceae bacterium]|nr:Uma2 family endonuclease [Chloroherpetonaceae bacterium]